MRKKLLSTALGIGLAFGIGVAGAQIVNKAVQLSQDPTGAYTVDSFFGINFPGHIFGNSTGFRAVPTVTGTGTPTLNTAASDSRGTVTMGTSATTATVLFGTAYGAVPDCVLAWSSGNASASPTGYTLATTSIAITQSAASANKIVYWCTSSS